AEHDELGLLLLLGQHRQPVAVAAGVGEADDLVALVVVAEDEDAVAQGGLGCRDAVRQLLWRSSGVPLWERELESEHEVGPPGSLRCADGGDSPVASPAGMSSPELDMSPDAG